MGPPLPRSAPCEDAELEIRPLFEPSDLGAEFTPVLRARHDHLRLEGERLNKKP